ncbi:MAG: zinc finger Ran-binding domain-containing protein [Clostridia bacterium]|nr:zinc finger Ran-binding domain-containing protein [Clostridia bacterium]
MSWICPVCSNSNSDSTSECFVCGTARATTSSSVAIKSGSSSMKSSSYSDDGDSEECNVVFSMGADIKDSISSFFAKIKNGFGDESKASTVKVKPGKKSDKKLVKTDDKKSTSSDKKSSDKKKTSSILPTFAAPWPEHKIKFDKDVIKNKGFVKSEQFEMDGVKGYRFYRESGDCQFIRAEMAVIQKLAKKV